MQEEFLTYTVVKSVYNKKYFFRETIIKFFVSNAYDILLVKGSIKLIFKLIHLCRVVIYLFLNHFLLSFLV